MWCRVTRKICRCADWSKADFCCQEKHIICSKLIRTHSYERLQENACRAAHGMEIECCPLPCVTAELKHCWHSTIVIATMAAHNERHDACAHAFLPFFFWPHYSATWNSWQSQCARHHTTESFSRNTAALSRMHQALLMRQKTSQCERGFMLPFSKSSIATARAPQDVSFSNSRHHLQSLQ